MDRLDEGGEGKDPGDPAPSRLDRLKAFLAERPGDPFLRFAIAMEKLRAGDERQAGEALDALLQDRPDYVGAYYHLGGILARAGRPEEASDVYLRGIRAAETAGDAHAASELRAALTDLEAD